MPDFGRIFVQSQGALLAQLGDATLAEMSQSPYYKWHSTTFDEVVGQEHITRTLQDNVTAGNIEQAHLFCGPRGTGKITRARLLAKAVNCLNEDLAKRPCDVCRCSRRQSPTSC